jgi:tetratricopeptide (TPR) repeat protein
MKRAATIGVVLGFAGLVYGQQPAPAKPNPQAAQSGAAQTGNTQQSGAPSQPAPGKRPPQAKTQPEFDAFNAARANADPSALEKAADDFATKFPDSELRLLLYKTAMHSYQAANNPDKMMEMGRRVLKLDADDPEALVGVAEVLAERTRDTDIDKDQRLDEAMKLAQRSIETVETDVAVPAGTPQDRIDAYKGFLRSSAFSIIGTLQFNQGKYTDAEASFHKSIDAFPAQPDPVVVLRLALALDKQEKYPDALPYAGQAASLAPENTQAGMVARKECERLAQLSKMPKPAACGASTTAPAENPPAPPKN